MLDAVGLSGRFPPSTGAADFGVTFNNGGPNKMDAYLEHQVNAVQRFEVTPANRVVAEQWRAAYDAIERCNAVLRLLDQTTDPTVTATTPGPSNENASPSTPVARRP
mgnify:CR=1 FL=1